KEKFLGTFRARFKNLLERLDRVNNIYEAISMITESDRLKVRCFNEMYHYEPVIDDPDTGGKVTPPKPKEVVRERTTKTFSKNQMIQGSKIFHSKEDVDRFVEELRSQLL